eukprot:47710_1
MTPRTTRNKKRSKRMEGEVVKKDMMKKPKPKSSGSDGSDGSGSGSGNDSSSDGSDDSSDEEAKPKRSDCNYSLIFIKLLIKYGEFLWRFGTDATNSRNLKKNGWDKFDACAHHILFHRPLLFLMLDGIKIKEIHQDKSVMELWQMYNEKNRFRNYGRLGQVRGGYPVPPSTTSTTLRGRNRVILDLPALFSSRIIGKWRKQFGPSYEERRAKSSEEIAPDTESSDEENDGQNKKKKEPRNDGQNMNDID